VWGTGRACVKRWAVRRSFDGPEAREEHLEIADDALHVLHDEKFLDDLDEKPVRPLALGREDGAPPSRRGSHTSPSVALLHDREAA
jgi:hypothetical protein